jgi:BirA family biotin operon repressor/biotin-[acetyl-CoA-carboxylase] ligase
MTDAAAWGSAALPTRRIGHAVEFHAEVGSTNDRARAALHEPGGEGRAVVADLQTAGRGRQGRSWSSPPGVNLMMSVAVRPSLTSRAAGLLGIAAALAVRNACAAAAGSELAIRWPNDVVAHDGLKVAGLLVETAFEADRLVQAVIGIGINVNWRRGNMPPEIAARATSLADVAGRDVDRVALLGSLLDALDAEIGALEAGNTPLPRLRRHSWLDGRLAEVELGDGSIAAGRVAGIAEDGSLLIDAAAGRIGLSAGEVVRVHDGSTAVPA